MNTRLFGILLMLLLSSCATKRGGSSASPAPDTPANNTSGLRLKGVGLLAQSLYQTLGPKKNISISGNEDDLFDTYSQNFGNTDGLRFGEVYADSPSTSYMLALAILASNAAARCQDELSQGVKTLCQCDTPEFAKKMLQRAFPTIDFSNSSHDDLVNHFASTCQSDYPTAIASMVSSIAFAVR